MSYKILYRESRTMDFLLGQGFKKCCERETLITDKLCYSLAISEALKGRHDTGMFTA